MENNTNTQIMFVSKCAGKLQIMFWTNTFKKILNIQRVKEIWEICISDWEHLWLMFHWQLYRWTNEHSKEKTSTIEESLSQLKELTHFHTNYH